MISTLFQLSITRLFFVSILPTFVASIVYIVLTLISPKKTISSEEHFEEKGGLGAFFIWLLAPFLILGGLFGGFLTPAEAGVVGIAFALLVGFFQKGISFRSILRAGVDALRDIGIIILVVIFAETFIKAIALSGYIQNTIQWFDVSVLPGAMAMLIVVLVLMLGSSIIGSVAMLYIGASFAFPSLLIFGYSAVSIGLLIAVSLALGPIVPPTGPIFVSLATGTTSGTKEVLKGVMFYMLSGIAMVALIISYPGLIDRMSKFLF
jgi:TRAP-type C4-dicarboxylate transport system permease large subunit